MIVKRIIDEESSSNKQLNKILHDEISSIHFDKSGTRLTSSSLTITNNIYVDQNVDKIYTLRINVMNKSYPFRQQLLDYFMLILIN